MRKILTSVLSVAGLLAVVLALASSPASAAKEVVTIRTPANATAGNAGTYTVSWETQGGCDPGSGTSGASGSVTLTVAETTPGGGTGDQAETGVVTDNVCNYTWSGTFTNAAGAGCALTVPDVSGGVIALTTGACATTSKLHVKVVGFPSVSAVTCTQAQVDAGDPAACTDTAVVLTPATANDLDKGAASATTFTITATPEEANGKVPEGCNAVSEDTEIDHTENVQKAVLTVADSALGGTSCTYTVTAALPPGFAAGNGEARHTGNSQTGVDPGTGGDGPDGEPGSGCGTDSATEECADNGEVTVDDLTVSVASAKVYLVQNVIGDAGGASAEYKYTAPCGAPGLPGALERTPPSGGITELAGRTVVELRTGRFNISEALPDGTAENGTAATALNDKGSACEATVSVSGVPAHCSVSHNSPASLATASGSVIIEVTVDCSPPPAPEPPAEEPMDDMGGDDMGGDDMGGDDMGGDDMGGDDMGGDDMGGDDMGGDDMGGDDMEDTGADDLGPPEDVATG